MKLFFEDGKLKLFIGEEATEQRRKFLHDTYYIFRIWDEKQPYTQVVQVESQYKYLIQEAKRHGIEIDQEVEDVYQYLIRKEEEERERVKKMEDQRKAIESAETVQERGCRWCNHLEYTPAHIEWVDGEKVYVGGRHTCSYAKRMCRYRSQDIEYEFEIRKEVRAFGKPIDDSCRDYVARPFPCVGCKYLEAARKAWEEINKEKEGNV